MEQLRQCVLSTEALVFWNLCSITRRATAVRVLGAEMKNSHCSLQLGKSASSNEDPAQSQPPSPQKSRSGGAANRENRARMAR